MPTDRALVGLLVVSLSLLALIFAGWLIVRFTRRWSASDSANDAPFTLEDLRRLHREGQISQSEFERMRQALLAQVAPKQTPAAPPRLPDPPPLEE